MHFIPLYMQCKPSAKTGLKLKFCHANAISRFTDIISMPLFAQSIAYWQVDCQSIYTNIIKLKRLFICLVVRAQSH